MAQDSFGFASPASQRPSSTPDMGTLAEQQRQERIAKSNTPSQARKLPMVPQISRARKLPMSPQSSRDEQAAMHARRAAAMPKKLRQQYLLRLNIDAELGEMIMTHLEGHDAEVIAAKARDADRDTIANRPLKPEEAADYGAARGQRTRRPGT